MGWIADLLKEIPSAARYKAELEAMEKENASLKTENSRLKSELDALKAKATGQPKLPDDVEKVLLFISQNEQTPAAHIAARLSLRQQVVDMHLEDLIGADYIDGSYAAMQETTYYLKQAGRRYLHSRGML